MIVIDCPILISFILPTVSPYFDRKKLPATFPMKNIVPKRPIIHFSLHRRSKSSSQLLRIICLEESG